MIFLIQLKVLRSVAVAIAIVWFGFLSIKAGYTHDPIFIENTQLTAEEGPYLPDGTISFALYGTLDNRLDSRGFRSKLKAGNQFVLSLLIPNLAPEKLLTQEQLPTLKVDRPDKSSVELIPENRAVFDEPFTGTSYLRLLSINEPAQNGVYLITIKGNHQARFTISIGTIELFGTPVENVLNRSYELKRISDWYSDFPDQAVRQSTQDKSLGTRFKENKFVIFGVVGLIILTVVILVRIRSTR